MSSTYAGGAAGPTVSTLTAPAIVVADMVGVGVFTSLGFQLQDISSGFSLLMLWVVGGVVALCGAFSYAELAAMFPRSSGEYNFLRRTYHPAVGFLAGWVSATVGFAALVHLAGFRLGSAFQNAWTAAKIALIVVFIAAGIWAGTGTGGAQPISFAPTTHDLTVMRSAAFAISLVFVMYSYSGRNAATYIIGEIREPQKAVPAALFAATFIVTLLYVGLNAVFLYTTPTV